MRHLEIARNKEGRGYQDQPYRGCPVVWPVGSLATVLLSTSAPMKATDPADFTKHSIVFICANPSASLHRGNRQLPPLRQVKSFTATEHPGTEKLCAALQTHIRRSFCDVTQGPAPPTLQPHAHPESPNRGCSMYS